MAKYIDLVLCKHENCDRLFLFQAPSWTRKLDKNSVVIVDTKHGEQIAHVVEKITIDAYSDEFEFIVKSSGASLPLRKVLSIIEYKLLEYEEEDDVNEQAGDDDTP